MKIFVAGASGVVGERLIPGLVANGHEVVGMTRSAAKGARARELGAEPAVADGLDRAAVIEVVKRAEPEVVIHQMTALSGLKSLRRFDHEFALTNPLRTEGTDNLLAAARAVGAKRFVAQSYGNWNYEPTGDGPKRETDRLDPDPPANQRRSLEAIRHLEQAVTNAPDIEGVVLRYGNFYGPGTSIAVDGELAELVRKRRLPVIGAGGGAWSFVHLDDAASAAVAAVERGAPGIYNACDDEPVAAAVWIAELATALDARPPRRVPNWVGRLAAGEVGLSMMTRMRGASNAKAKRELGWEPRYRSVVEGFRAGLERPPPGPHGERKGPAARMSERGRASGFDAFAELRPLMFSIAYRMLGSVGDAEEIVQETFLRIHRALGEGERIESPRAYATTLTTRLAIDQLRAARTTRESYFGPWLPEPVVSADEGPERIAEMADSLSLAFLVLLEQLSPAERAVFLLREVFDYGYDEIAGILETSEANCRQIFSRARRRIDAGRERFESDRAEQRELAAKFFAAVEAGRLDELVAYLAEDVTFQGDGGGKGRGLPQPVYGRERVNRLLRDSFFPGYERIGARIVPTEVNGEPGALCFDAEGRLINVFSFEIGGGFVNTVRSVINPDKLAHLGYELSPQAVVDRS